MGIANAKELLQDAYENKYALGAFGAHNLETMKGIIQGAEKVGMPIIFQTTGSTYRYVGINTMVAIVRSLAEQSKIPIALQLDHGKSFQEVMECIRAGYTSIMIDGSHLALEENIALVKQVVAAAHAVGLPVEAELGAIGTQGHGDEQAQFTDPEEADYFVRSTNIDFLAPAFGTIHGNYVKEPHLQFDLLKEIQEKRPIPLVMHGASEVPNEAVKKAIQHGVAKVNFSTEIKDLFALEIQRFFQKNPEEKDPRKYFIEARQAVAELVEQKVQLLAGR